MRICSSGLENEPCDPFSDRMPMISNGMPRIRSSCPIIAAALALSMVGTAEARTAKRRRAASSPAVNMRPAVMV